MFLELLLLSTVGMPVCASIKTPTHKELGNVLARLLTLRQTIDTLKRIINFREQFSAIYCFPNGYFDVRDKNNVTQFDRDCNKILDGFKSKFPVVGNRESYLNTFSYSKWCELSVNERKQHSLSKCARCFELHQNSQLSFPLKPTYHHNEPIITVNQEPIITVNQDAVKKLGIKKFATSVLTELNRVCENEASTSFTDALVSINSSGLEKKGKRDKRREKVKLQKEFTKKVNDLFAEKAAISMLTECESKRKYHRKHMSQSFHSPQEQPPAKKKLKPIHQTFPRCPGIKRS